MTPLMAQFITEGRDLLEQASVALLALEQDPSQTEHLDALFRAVHTIKGASGLFDIRPFTQAVHAGEDLLDAVRAGDVPLGPELTDLLLEMLDRVADWMGELEQSEALGAQAASQGEDLARRLRDLLDAAALMPDLDMIEEDEITADPGVRPAGMPADIAPQGGAQVITYHPSEHCFFAGADPLLTAMTTPGLLWLEPIQPEPVALDLLDPFVARVGYAAVSDAPRAELEAHFLYVEDEVSYQPLAPAARAAAASLLTADTVAGSADMALAVDLIASQRRLLVAGGSAAHAAVRSVLLRIATRLVRPEIAASLARVDVDSGTAGPELDRLANQLTDSFAAPGSAQADAPAPLSTAKASPAAAAKPVAPPPAKAPSDKGASPAAKPADSPPRLDPSAPAPAADEAEADAPAAAGARKATAIRVDSERIDQLMNLVGELIVAKNALPFLVRRAEELSEARGLARDIKAQHDAINRIADELQTSVMQIRMVPVGTVLGRFNRLVRDLARKLDKRISLVIEGEETEADKAVVEELSDPMVHLIRNAVDHGLETREERRAAGKPEEGRIKLTAYQRDDSVVIEIADDGRGIDVAKVKAKAQKAGLIDADMAASMTDEAALQLILAPGLSTRDEISDLSGRGVGMDVVASMVRRVGGTIAVQSTPGQGTTVRVSLPLSMAVQRLMMLEVDGGLYGVSVDSVVESQRLPVGCIHRHRDDEMVLLRSRMIPLLRLRGLFGCPPEESKEDINVMVVDVDGNEVGLVVDRFHAGVDAIVKPMEGILNDVGCFSGTALLGDGSVLLALNLPEVLACRWK